MLIELGEKLREGSERPFALALDALCHYALTDKTEPLEAALAECRGRVAGSSGAAAKLGVPPSTLDHRIKALGISKTQFKFR